ncbi:DNA-binding response regulator, partial [Pseudomonas syringae pv. tagetis]
INFDSYNNVVEVAIKLLRAKLYCPHEHTLLHTILCMCYVMENLIAG